MQKFFSKISSSLISVTVIVTVMVTLSPVALMMAFLQEAKPPSSVQIVASDSIEHINCLVPKPSQELVVSFLNKQWTGLFSFFDGFALSDKVHACVEGDDYFYNNDIRFNIPTLTYRQPASEHSSEG